MADKISKVFHKAAGYASSVKVEVINTVSNAIAYGMSTKSRKKLKQANKDLATIKRARSYDDAPNFVENEKGFMQHTKAFEARVMADEVRERSIREAAKGRKKKGLKPVKTKDYSYISGR